MNKALKWGLIVCGSLVIIVIAALLIIPMFVDVQKYKPELEKKIAAATGRPFSVGDDLNLSLFPWAGISFADLQLGNPPGFVEKDFVAVKAFEVRIKLIPLIFKDIQVKRFILTEPHIVLVKNKDGRVNWEQPMGSKEKAPAKETEKDLQAPAADTGLPIKTLAIGDFAIKNGSAVWIDHASDTRKEITDVNLGLRDVSLERPVKLSFSALLDSQPLSIDGTVGPIGKDFKQATIPLDLNVKALKQLILKLNGNLKNPGSNPGIELAVEIKEFSPRKLMAALDQTFPTTTADPNALGRMALKANVKANPKNVAISDGILNLDESTLNFALNASDFSRPNLSFDLSVDQINVDRYIPPKSEKKPAAEKTAETKATDYKPLRRLILDGRIKIGKLIVSKAKVEDILLHIKAKDGIINLDPLKLNLYQGNVSGNGNLNVQQDTPKSNLSFDVTNIQVGPLLQDVLEKDILEGVSNAQITLAMSGDNEVMIKKTLNGNGQVRFNDGAIVGFDLAAMVRNVKAAFGMEKAEGQRPRTDFSELNAPFTIRNGLVNTPQTSLKSPLIRVIAAGDADLVKETLDFRVEPKVVATIKGQGDEDQRSGLMVPVLVSGTFSEPKFRPDLAGVAKKQLEEKILESEEAQKLMEKEELKPLKETAKGVLKGILGE
jgi:AsmA protein